MDIKPIAARRLYQRVAEELESYVADGTFAVGKRMPAERELAKRFQVSRTSLREAISLLEIAGLVEVRVGSGIYVRSRGPTVAMVPDGALSPFDVLKARSLVEPEAAGLAALNASRAQVSELERIYKHLASALRSDTPLPDADRQFHVAIASASGNGALEMIVSILWSHWIDRLNTRIAELFVTPKHKRDSIEEHRCVLDAIRSGDSGGARLAMRRHLTSVARQRLSKS